jgi:hypothetical protein
MSTPDPSACDFCAHGDQWQTPDGTVTRICHRDAIRMGIYFVPGWRNMTHPDKHSRARHPSTRKDYQP